MPAEPNVAERTIRAATLDAKGEPGRGLTRALSGSVQYRERGAGVDRGATSGDLDVGLKPGSARLKTRSSRTPSASRTARCRPGGCRPLRYDKAHAGAERIRNRCPGSARRQRTDHRGCHEPSTSRWAAHDEGDRQREERRCGRQPKAASRAKRQRREDAVDAEAGSAGDRRRRTRSITTAHAEGHLHRRAAGQGDTSIKGDTIVIDDKTGNLTASGNVMTTTSTTSRRTRTRRRSAFTPSRRRRTSSTKMRTAPDVYRHAHMNGPEGDMTAARIELYLKPSGDELDRAEAYDAVTLREQNRTTKGSHDSTRRRTRPTSSPARR